jgi:UPF0755 protein
VSWPRLLCAAALAIAALLGATAYAVKQILSPVASVAQPLIFEVPRGASLQTIAERLEAEGLVRNADAVELLARYRGFGTALRAGEYRLSPTSTPDQILETLAAGRVVTYEVAVPEGFTAAMIAERLEAANLVNAEAFLAWVHDPASPAVYGVEGTSLEGYLFPETYRLPRGFTPRETAAVFVNQFLAVWRELEPRARSRNLSMHEVVTLASIVEKETAVPEERGLIAAVFLNRLKRGMRLETDPAVIYGIPHFDGNLRRADLEDPDNPYNTYLIAGLPPGPIANPGRDALAAVVDPPDVDYLYFVSRNDGTHHFSRTYRDHLRAVSEYQTRRSP